MIGLRLHVLADASINLHQLYRCAVHFNEGDQDTAAWTIGFDDYFLALEGSLKVVHLERNMGDGLHETRIGCVLPVSLPLDTERVILVVADGDLEVREWDLTLEWGRGRNANVVVLHHLSAPRFSPQQFGRLPIPARRSPIAPRGQGELRLRSTHGTRPIRDSSNGCGWDHRGFRPSSDAQ